MKQYTIAFVGNPNVGKSAWINALSNANFKVGNWPGVTIEKKEAKVTWFGNEYHLLDLPGTYSLEDSDNEENVAARFIKNETIDLFVNVVDATNLSRNLVLTLCLRELQIPMILVFNFMDEVEKYHIQIEVGKLARRLQIPILAYSAFDKAHISCVRDAIIKHCATSVLYYPLLSNAYYEIYVDVYNYMEKHVVKSFTMNEKTLHTLCMQYLYEDEKVIRQLNSWNIDMIALRQMKKELNREKMLYDKQMCIDSLMNYVREDKNMRYALSNKIDQIILHKVFGLPILFMIFSILLLFVFQASAPFHDYIMFLINDIVSKYVGYMFLYAPTSIQSFVLQGIISGVGGVLSFVPLMSFLYLGLSLLEESGYNARCAFLLDRFMNTFHLSGKSFVALLLGFGCNVPAIYATRTLDNEKQKRLTALLIPFMSCGARLPIYVLFATAFFPNKAYLMILSVYGIGVFMALLCACLFSKLTSFKEDALFVLELPPYRMPSRKVVVHKVKEEVKAYVKKAVGVVMLAMMILWGFTYFPSGDSNTSYIARGAKVFVPIYEPLGFGTRWESIAALPGGIIAKETIIGYFDTLMSQNETQKDEHIEPLEDLKEIGFRFIAALRDSVLSCVRFHVQLEPSSNQQVQQIQSLWTDDAAPLRAFSYMVYVLLSIPCIMSLQALYHEYGWKLLLVSLISMMIIPYIVSLFIFQFFSLFI
ncbi:MAG: ferrous iron transport protein B [Longicatena sp.]